MDVRTILKAKGNRVLSVAPSSTVAEAASILERERIGSVLVLDGSGRLVGVLSERDIVSGIARSGANCLELKVESVMTRNVVTCRQEDSVNTIMALMTERRVRHLPVMDGDELIGIISIGDVVKHRLAEVESEAQSLREYITTA